MNTESKLSKIIDGKMIAQLIANHVKNKLQGKDAKIVVFLIGTNEASKIYIKNKRNVPLKCKANLL